MVYERAQIDTIEKLEMVIEAAQRKYVTVKEGAALYGMGVHGFDNLAKDAGAKRKIVVGIVSAGIKSGHKSIRCRQRSLFVEKATDIRIQSIMYRSILK